MNLIIDFNKKSPKYLIIYDHIKNEIISGHLKKNDTIPSIRTISKSLEVSKSTIENAYSQLLAEGYIESKYKSGYFVSYVGDIDFMSHRNLSPLYDNKSYENSKNNIESNLFDFNIWKKLNNQVLDYEQTSLLSSGDNQGEYDLRVEISKFIYEYRGGICKPEQIIIGAGTQFLFGLIATIFRSSSQYIAFESPGFSKGKYIFEDYGYKTIEIPLEQDGISLKYLNKSKANIVYVSPSHQYPMGNIMSINKRINLVKWAVNNNSYILEDDYDSMFRYDGHPIPALQGLNNGENVIYFNSFSKLAYPGLRVSFMILPEKLLKRYFSIKSRYTQTVSKLDQITLCKFIQEGYFIKHLRKFKNILSKKNQLLLDSFKKYISPHIKLLGVSTGFHIVLFLDKSVNLNQVLKLSKKDNINLKKVDNLKDENLIIFYYSKYENNILEQIIKTLISNIENSSK